MSEKNQNNVEIVCECVICAIQWTLLGAIIALGVKGCIYKSVLEMELQASREAREERVQK